MSPNGQMPILKLPDGRLMAESIEICKYLVRQPSPVSDTCPISVDETQSEVFNIANTAPIIWDRYAGPGGDSPVNGAWLLNFLPWSDAQPLLPVYKQRVMPSLKALEAKLLAIGGPFFSAEIPGIGDFCLFAHVGNIVTLIPDLLEDVGPCMQAWFKACAALPRIGEYMAERPQVGTRALGMPRSFMFEGATQKAPQALPCMV